MESAIVGNGWKCGLFNICLGLILIVGLGILSFMFYGMIGGEYKKYISNIDQIFDKKTWLITSKKVNTSFIEMQYFSPE